MKKILITLFQVSVTIAVLYWVYHDPNKRAQMVEAIRNAQYRWVAIGILHTWSWKLLQPFAGTFCLKFKRST